MLSFPIPLRILFATYPELLTPVLRIILRVIAGFLLKQAGLKGCAADTGAHARLGQTHSDRFREGAISAADLYEKLAIAVESAI